MTVQTSDKPATADEKQHFYDTHIFCCVNERPKGHPRGCCADRGGKELHAHFKKRAKELGIKNIRVNQSGCLERCELGPTLVIYPEGTWYNAETVDDVEEILTKHVLNGERVERLYLEPDQKRPKPKLRNQLKLTVSRVEDLSSTIRLFELVAPDGGMLPEFTAGAHIDIVTGGGHRRSYSLANDPAERHRYVLGIMREKAGRGGSAWMHDNVKAGDTLTVMPPSNAFPLAESAGEHILIGGGIGITPMKAMAHRLKAIGEKYTLYYCSREQADTAFYDEIKELCGDNVVFTHDGGDPAKGLNFKTLLAEHRPGSHVYICGPNGFLNAVRAATAHWPEGCVHFELFSPPPAVAKEGQVNEPFEVLLSRQGLTVPVPADKSILEAVRAAGIDVDSSCEEGVCSTCEVRLLAGAADHRDAVLSAEDKAANKKIMTCVSRAAPGVKKLILDL
ncbi:MAG: 2Fe-2S iron-sulfur cluster-binding protein [Alphaproteobacteria bacterium]